eukprot:scaffold51864_cov62-Phaeocystis_antarctica.AAC.2
MRRVLKPYLLSALNRCRRFKLAVVQTCNCTVGNWPVAVAQLARRSIARTQLARCSLRGC